MLHLSELYLFSMTSLMILIVPGPAVMYGTLQSLQHGRTAGIVAVLGLELATLFHVAVAALGVPALASSIQLFHLLKWLGAAYLIYLSLSKLLSHPTTQQHLSPHKSLKQIFWQGVLVELLNPKTVLFFFAFLPQFIAPTQGNVALQMLKLGCLFVGFAIMIDLLYATLASSIRRGLKSKRCWMKKLHYVESSVYFGLGVTVALSS